MNKILRLIFVLCICNIISSCDQNYSFELSVSEFQEELNKAFSDSVKSPLAEEERATFDGLPFYPANPDLRVEARYKRIAGKVVEIPTTTGRTARYQPYGLLNFDLKGKPFELTVFRTVAFPSNQVEEKKVPLFLPFTDLTNGDDTYGGGRYIDIEEQEGSKWVLDFNQAYNPYCAYNDKYSCPIPPKENHLEFRIEAGVKYDATDY